MLLLTLASAAAAAGGPYLIGRAVDKFIAAGDPAGLATNMLLLLGVYLAGMGARIFQSYLMGWVAQNTLAGSEERSSARSSDSLSPTLTNTMPAT